jgi:hypothetical protein
MTALRTDNYRMKTLSDVAKDALEPPAGQGLTLAHILLDLSEPDQDFSAEVEAAWEQEIVRRMEAVKGGTAQSKSFERIFTELDGRFP